MQVKITECPNTSLAEDLSSETLEDELIMVSKDENVIKSDRVANATKKEETSKIKIDSKSIKKKSDDLFVPSIMFSAVDCESKKEYMEIVTKLGGIITTSPRHCTHLVMGKLSRTDKFLQVLPVVHQVVGPGWLLESMGTGCWVEEAPYSLSSKEMETKFGFSLGATLARRNRDKLFTGKTFYLTPHVKPGIDVLRNIVESAGGRY